MLVSYCGSSFAEWPERIKTTFINTKKNHCGIYGVIFYVDGEKIVQIVDDFFMHNDEGRCCAQAGFKKGKFWVSILEKAFAKLFGSYERMWGGISGDAWNIFTGQPCRMIYHRDVDTDMVFDWLERCDNANYALSSAVKPEPANEDEA